MISIIQVTRYRDEETGEVFETAEAAEREASIRHLAEKVNHSDVYLYDADLKALAEWLIDNFDMTPKVKS